MTSAPRGLPIRYPPFSPGWSANDNAMVARMTGEGVGAVAKSMGQPDRTTTFLDGSVRVAVELLGAVVIGHGVYQPGWRWSLHAGPLKVAPHSATSATCSTAAWP